MRNDVDLEAISEALISAQGIKGIKNRLISSTIFHYLYRTKKRFGIDMDFDETQSSVVIEWIKKYDKKFKEHISNPYIDLKTNKFKKEEPIIDGEFFFKLDKATYLFVRGKNTPILDRNINVQKLHLYIFGKKSIVWFHKLTKFIEHKRATTQKLYNVTAGAEGNRSYWSCTGSKLVPRTIDSLFFDQDIKNKVISHLDNWILNSSIFEERGLIFKTGILLYGKRGTGKSSLANAIANYLKCSMITIDITTFHNLNISEVIDAIESDETMYVVLIDEIDTIFTSRDEENQSDKQKENVAKLLTLLDSPNSPTNVVFVATTNYYDRLDKALLRKGRFDLSLELSDISRETAIKMCESFNLSNEESNRLLINEGFPINPAHLQSIILEFISERNKNMKGNDENVL